MGAVASCRNWLASSISHGLKGLLNGLSGGMYLVNSGLKKEDAYKTLTLHPARLLGLEERLGSIEKGRDADLVFFDGDPLDPHTTVQRVMILGKTVYNADEDE